jgi:hypothetical protein
MIDSFVMRWPKSINLYVYYENSRPPKENSQVKKIDFFSVAPDLVAFRNKYKDDPVAHGDLKLIEGGVRRPSEFNGLDKNKKTFLFDAVRFAHKTFCVDHAIKNIDTDMILWLDADTYTFTNIDEEFIRNTLPTDKMVCYLGRNKGWPECGWVGYNKNHPQLKEFMVQWTNLYKKDTIFNEIEWHDSYVWYQTLLKIGKDFGYDIGEGAGAKGKHIFVNSVLGKYIDHMKGNRKQFGKSYKADLTTEPSHVDYWRNL